MPSTRPRLRRDPQPKKKFTLLEEISPSDDDVPEDVAFRDHNVEKFFRRWRHHWCVESYASVSNCAAIEFYNQGVLQIAVCAWQDYYYYMLNHEMWAEQLVSALTNARDYIQGAIMTY